MPRYSITKLLNIPTHKVIKLRVDEEKAEIHIWLEARKNRPFVCSGCGQIHKTGNHGKSTLVAEDLPISGHRVFLHVTRRRYVCPHDQKTHVEEIPWLLIWHRFTTRFSEQLYRLTSITTNKEAGWYMGLDDETVYRIDKEILERKYEQKLEPFPAAVNMSVDEVSYKKYHRYLTNVVDVDKKVVIWNAQGRKAEVLDQYYEGIGEEQCKRIESVALDGARTYIASSGRHAVNALIVCDKFHVASKMNRAVDSVRKMELHKARKEGNLDLVEMINGRQRFILFRNRQNRTSRQTEHLDHLCRKNEQIYKAMLLKESFLGVYNCSGAQAAEEYLKEWVEQARTSGLQAFEELSQSIDDKLQLIVNWFKKKVSSAISEGINNKIKRLKRMAYGYKDIDYFRLKIHQHCGLLNPRRFPH